MKTRDSDRVRRFQNSEPGGFDALYDEYGDRIYRFCYRLCGHASDAEDLAQEVFLAAYQGLERFAGRSSLATWLFRIALYRWKRLHGGDAAETVPLDDSLLEAAATPDPGRTSVERLWLEGALAALPQPQREAFLLVKAEGLRYREAAEVLGIPQGTVQWRVHEAVVRLRALLVDEYADHSAPRGDLPEARGSSCSARCSPDPALGETPLAAAPEMAEKVSDDV